MQGRLCAQRAQAVALRAWRGQQREAWLVIYSDGHKEHFEEEELRSGKHGEVSAGQGGKPVLVVRDMPERKAIYDGLVPERGSASPALSVLSLG